MKPYTIILLIDKKKMRNKNENCYNLLKISLIIVDKYLDFVGKYPFKKRKKSYIGTFKKNE